MAGEDREPEGEGTAALLETAVGHHQAGRLGEAEDLYRRILEIDGEHGDALHLLGLVAHQTGSNEAAARLIERAIAAEADFSSYHANLAIVRRALGEARAAEAAARRAAELAPGDAGAHNLLGLALRDQGRLGDAEAALSEAVRLDPGNAANRNNLGSLLRSRGRGDEAAAAFRSAIEADPGFAMAHANLGALLRAEGNLAEAESTCRRALELDPASLDARINLGNVLKDLKKNADAEAEYRQVLAADPGNVGAKLNLAAVLGLQERTAEALAAFDEILALDAKRAEAWNGKGVTLLNAGHIREATEAFEAAIAADPDHIEACYNLAGSSGARLDGAALAHLEALLAEPARSADERMKLHYVLARAAEKGGDDGGAFDHYAASNRVRRAALARAGHTFDAEAHGRLEDAIAAFHTKAFFAQRSGFGSVSEHPVFIVGPPRSGTTLVEQIAAAHPEVHGGGELGLMPGFVKALAARAGRDAFHPDGSAAMDARQSAALADAYLKELRALAPGAARILDKQPFNYRHLGLIQLLFPKGRVIYCRRDPRDTGLSCFTNLFVDPLPWTTDLEEIGIFILGVERLMAHWRAVLEIPILEVSYEALVAEPEGESRRIVEFLGLPWDPACLSFHLASRVVHTASKWQVREPVYTASVGRWRRHAAALAPMIQALDAG